MNEEKKNELKIEELEQVAGGEDFEHDYTVFACNQCGHEIKWPGRNYKCYQEYAVDCEMCDCKVYHWVRFVE